MNCEVCDGPLIVLGVLGNTVHLRCRNCGMDHTGDPADLPENEEDDDD